MIRQIKFTRHFCWDQVGRYSSTAKLLGAHLIYCTPLLSLGLIPEHLFVLIVSIKWWNIARVMIELNSASRGFPNRKHFGVPEGLKLQWFQYDSTFRFLWEAFFTSLGLKGMQDVMRCRLLNCWRCLCMCLLQNGSFYDPGVVLWIGMWMLAEDIAPFISCLLVFKPKNHLWSGPFN